LPENIESQAIFTLAGHQGYYELHPKRHIQTRKTLGFRRLPETQIYLF
jgi:hypothetical protein